MILDKTHGCIIESVTKWEGARKDRDRVGGRGRVEFVRHEDASLHTPLLFVLACFQEVELTGR